MAKQLQSLNLNVISVFFSSFLFQLVKLIFSFPWQLQNCPSGYLYLRLEITDINCSDPASIKARCLFCPVTILQQPQSHDCNYYADNLDLLAITTQEVTASEGLMNKFILKCTFV